MKTNIVFVIAALLAVSCKPAETTAAGSAKAYPLNTCIVSGEKLGGMGKPYEFVHDGRQIKLCCKSCLPDFEKEPAKYLSKLE